MIKVWDGFIRFFHLLLIALIATLYFSAENGQMALHLISAYLLLALILTRLIWGIIGSDTAKLAALFHHPKAVISAIITPKTTIGHNPAGSYMVLVFFALILTQLISGLMTTDDIYTDGPLVAYVASETVELASSIHHSNFDFILAAIVLHITAIVIYRIRGKALTKAMITGYQSTELPAPQLKSPWLGFVIFVVLSVILLATWGAEPLSELLGT